MTDEDIQEIARLKSWSDELRNEYNRMRSETERELIEIRSRESLASRHTAPSDGQL